MSTDQSCALSPEFRELIRALARLAVADYLASQAAAAKAQAENRPNPSPLPDLDAAA